MPKSSLLLLDADVIIDLHACGLWKAVVAKYNIYIAETVVEETKYYLDVSGRKVSLDLKKGIKNKEFVMVSATLEEMTEASARLQKTVYGSLDAGELESAAIIVGKRIENLVFCIQDALPIKALACLGFDPQIISIEAMLKNGGILKPNQEVDWAFSEKRFREKVLEGKLGIL